MNDAIIVDEHDTIIRHGDRHDITSSERIRISGVWITSPTGKILLAQRSKKKRQDPGVWATAVAGTVEPNETYEQNAHKEVHEELGIIAKNMREGPKLVFPNRVCTFFFLTIPEDTLLHPRADEVEAVRWFTQKELLEFFTTSPEQFGPNAKLYLPALLKEHP